MIIAYLLSHPQFNIWYISYHILSILGHLYTARCGMLYYRIRILDKSPVPSFKTGSRPDWLNHFNRWRSNKKMEDETDGKINVPFFPLTCLWKSKGHLLQGKNHLFEKLQKTFHALSVLSCFVFFSFFMQNLLVSRVRVFIRHWRLENSPVTTQNYSPKFCLFPERVLSFHNNPTVPLQYSCTTPIILNEDPVRYGNN